MLCPESSEFSVTGLTEIALDDRPPFYSGIQKFLDLAVIDSEYLYVDLWSFVHLASGIVLGAVFARLARPVFALAWAVGLILAYEVIELALVDVLFVPEEPVDTIWDIVIGFAGAFAALRVSTVLAKRKANKRKESMYL